MFPKLKSKITSTDFRNKQLNNQAKSITNNDNNGFFCIKIVDDVHENKNLYLWNPSLRDSFSKMIHLVSFNGPSEKTYFGFAYFQNNEFKVLGIDSDNSEKADLFTLNARGEVMNRTIVTWVESLGATVSYVSANPLLFFNGALHCLMWHFMVH